MARKKKSYAEQMAIYKQNIAAMQEKMQKFREAHSEKWFKELHDILQKGIDDDSIDIESLTPADVFNFCLQKSSSENNGAHAEQKEETPKDSTEHAQKESEKQKESLGDESSKTDDKKDNTTTTPAWGETSFV